LPRSQNGELDVSILLRHLVDAEELTVNYALMQAYKKSGGKYKRAKLIKLGHPYAERKGGVGVPYGDPSMINVQTSNFYFGWNKKDPKLAGGSINSQIYNNSPYADELAMGIKGLTIPRPLIRSIMHNTNYWRERNLAKGVRNAIGQM